MNVSQINIQQVKHNFDNCYELKYQGNIRQLCISENATYKVIASNRSQYVLRLHRPNYHSLIIIQSELAWLLALQQDNIHAPIPIKGKNYDYVQSFKFGDNDVYAVLFHWINGEEPAAADSDLSASFKRLGYMNAKLHEHTKGWIQPSSFVRPIWSHENMLGEDGYWGDWKNGYLLDNQHYPLIKETIEIIKSKLAVYGQNHTNFGLIHADLRLANLLVDQNCTSVIDFDDCGFGWFLHDLASALSFHEHLPEAKLWVNEWLEGYHQVASLTQKDLDMIDTFIIQRRLQLLAWTGSHSYTQTTQDLGADWVDETIKMCKDFVSG